MAAAGLVSEFDLDEPSEDISADEPAKKRARPGGRGRVGAAGGRGSGGKVARGSGGGAGSKVAKGILKRDNRNTAGRHKGGGGPAAAAASNKKHKRFCRGCHETMELDRFALNQSVCFDCKASLDVIAKMARAQGKSDWFAEQRSDDNKCKRMLDNYRGTKKEADAKGLKRAKWSVAKYQETVKYASGMDFRAQGRMMWKLEAIEYWQTTAGGQHSLDEAKARWKHESLNFKSLDIPTDMKWPSKAPFRLRVCIGDVVDYYNQVERSKEAIGEESLKKASQDDMNKYLKELTSNHDKVLGAKSSLEDVAFLTIGASAGSSFDAAAAGFSGDITTLAPEAVDAADEDEGDDAEEGEEEENPEEDAAEEAENKKKSWFDVDRSRNSAHKSMLAVYETTRAQAVAVKSEVEKHIKNMQAFQPSEQHFFQGELKIATSRCTAVGYLFGDSEPLKEYVKSFAAGASSSPVKGASTASGDPIAALGQAPPTRSYDKLVTFTEWRSSVEEVFECTDPESIEKLKKSCLALKGPIVELITACKTVLSDIKKAHKARDSWKASQQQAKPRKRVTPAGGGAASGLFEIVPPKASEVPHLQELEDGSIGPVEICFEKPLLVKPNGVKKASMENDKELKAFMMESLQRDFETCGAVSGMDRAQKQLPSAIFDVVQRRVSSMMPGLPMPAPDAPDIIKQAMTPVAVIVAKGAETISHERGFLGSCRIGWAGTREIIAASLPSLQAFFQAKATPGSKFTIRTIKEYFKNLSAEQIDEFKGRGFELFHATVGPGCAFYIPCGFIFAERVQPTHCFLGFRCGVFVANLQCKKDLEDLAGLWPNDLSSAMVDAITASMALAATALLPPASLSLPSPLPPAPQVGAAAASLPLPSVGLQPAPQDGVADDVPLS